MSYAVIRSLLQEKLQTAVSSAKVHERWRFTLEPTVTADFKDKFSDGQRLNTFIITQDGFSDGQAFEDDRILRRHNILIMAYRSFKDSEQSESENEFNEVLHNIAMEFTLGDRTLSENALCHSLPEFSGIDIDDKFGARRISVHVCKIRIFVDEVINI